MQGGTVNCVVASTFTFMTVAFAFAFVLLILPALAKGATGGVIALDFDVVAAVGASIIVRGAGASSRR